LSPQVYFLKFGKQKRFGKKWPWVRGTQFYDFQNYTFGLRKASRVRGCRGGGTKFYDFVFKMFKNFTNRKTQFGPGKK